MERGGKRSATPLWDGVERRGKPKPPQHATNQPDMQCPFVLWSAVASEARHRFYGGWLFVFAQAEIIIHLQSVGFQIVDRFDLGRCGRSLKPSRRTPRVLIGNRHKPVHDGILMRVIQSRQVRFLVSQPRLADVVPDLASRSLVQLVDPLGGPFVKQGEHPTKAVRAFFSGGRMANKMIMIGKHCPAFQPPVKLLCDDEQAAMQDGQALRASKMMRFMICSDGDEKRPALRELVQRGVRPWRLAG